MEIKIKNVSYEELTKEPSCKDLVAKKPSFLLQKTIFLISSFIYFLKGFKYKNINVSKDIKKEPCLILMNHGSFIDLLIAFKILKFHSFNIVTMDEAFVGREKLLTKVGCFPIYKFVSSPSMVINSIKLVKNYNQSILIFPEGAYSFDGTASPIAPHIGKYIKMLNVPVLYLKTRGAHLHQPLFNHLNKRKIKCSATLELLLSKEDVNNKNNVEIYNIITNKFKQINYYKEQLEDKVLIKENNRCDYLEAVLYKCPHCLKEGKMLARGKTIKCIECNNEYVLNEDGTVSNLNGNTLFKSIPDWYKWERECVKKEILNNSFSENYEGIVYACKNHDYLYKLNEKGYLTFKQDGILNLKIGDTNLSYDQSKSYSITADLYFYQLGDVISVGDNKIRFFITPTNKYSGIVTKIRFGVEELYKLNNK